MIARYQARLFDIMDRMRRRDRQVLLTIGIGALVVACITVAAIRSDGSSTSASTAHVTVSTVERGNLADLVTAAGTLTHLAQADGSPYTAINRASGTYTLLPTTGQEIACGSVFYRVDDAPVLMMCGAVPAYRTLEQGMSGRDVRQLNADLHELRMDSGSGNRIASTDPSFSSRTRAALMRLQRARGASATGKLEVSDVVILPSALKVTKPEAMNGSTAQPGTPVARVTSSELVVQVQLETTQQGEVQVGDTAEVVLPNNETATGKVIRIGQVVDTADEQSGAPSSPSIPAFIRLSDPAEADGYDEAPVRVSITTAGVRDVLNVPVAALVGRSGGGFAVEMARVGDRRELVEVTLGLFDGSTGRVEVTGELHEGEHVVVPAG